MAISPQRLIRSTYIARIARSSLIAPLSCIKQNFWIDCASFHRCIVFKGLSCRVIVLTVKTLRNVHYRKRRRYENLYESTLILHTQESCGIGPKQHRISMHHDYGVAFSHRGDIDLFKMINRSILAPPVSGNVEIEQINR